MTTVTTTEPVDTWEMVLVHRVFRREFRLLPGLVRAVPAGDTVRAEIIGEHLSNVAALHHHHNSEDELLWPLLLERAGMHAALIHRMEAQHERLHEPLARIEEITPRWRERAAVADREALAEVIAQASVALDEHLSDEEQQILPLVPRHLTHAEWDALGRRGQESIPKGKMALVFLGALFEEATPAERKRFLAGMPSPVRVIWRLFGDRTYRKARDQVRIG
jgi:hemerythrin-like domain-containing protein